MINEKNIENEIYMCVMNEIWRDIVGYEGLYQISNLGNVKSLNYRRTGKERILNPGNNGSEYLFVILCKNGKRKNFTIHRLVANAFLENSDDKSDVNHKDEDKTNNCVDNLEWMSRKENINFGTHNQRSAKSRSKSVIQYSLDGKFIKEWPSIIQIERDLGFSKGNISQCCNGKRKSAYGYVWKFA